MPGGDSKRVLQAEQLGHPCSPIALAHCSPRCCPPIYDIYDDLITRTVEGSDAQTQATVPQQPFHTCVSMICWQGDAISLRKSARESNPPLIIVPCAIIWTVSWWTIIRIVGGGCYSEICVEKACKNKLKINFPNPNDQFFCTSPTRR